MKRFVLALLLALVCVVPAAADRGSDMGVFSMGWSIVLDDGTELMLTSDNGVLVETVLGAGMPPIENITQPYAIADGSYWQRSIVRQRVFTLLIRAIGCDVRGLHAVRSRLIAAASPHRATVPWLVRYRDGVDAYEIEAVYDGGLELQATEAFSEGIPLRMLAVDSYWRLLMDVDTGQLPGSFQQANTNRIDLRDAQGNWSNLANGADNTVRTVAYDAQGRLYAGGAFHNIGGVAANHIARYDPATGNWSALGVGVDDDVYTIALQPTTGDMFVGGAFHNAGGAGALHCARYTGAAWAALGAGTDNVVQDWIWGGTFGVMYACGQFVNAGGGAALRIANWNGAVWAAVGAGLSDTATEMTLGRDGYLYVVGGFTAVGGGGITLNYVGRWTGTAWQALGTGLAGGVPVGNAVCAMADGRIVVGGNFASAGGLAARSVAIWNGAGWQALGVGLGTGIEAVYALYVDPWGLLRAMGDFTTSGDGLIAFPMCHAVWRSPYWVAGESAAFGGGVTQYEMAFSANNDMVFAGTFSGPLNHPAVSVITNLGSANAWPVIIFRFSAPIYHLINFTTGKRIDFNIAMLGGETLTLDLRPGRKTFVSNFRGNVLSGVLGGSDLTTWALAPGANNVSIWVNGGTAQMTYRRMFWSIDGAQ